MFPALMTLVIARAARRGRCGCRLLLGRRGRSLVARLGLGLLVLAALLTAFARLIRRLSGRILRLGFACLRPFARGALLAPAITSSLPLPTLWRVRGWRRCSGGLGGRLGRGWSLLSGRRSPFAGRGLGRLCNFEWPLKGVVLCRQRCARDSGERRQREGGREEVAAHNLGPGDCGWAAPIGEILLTL